MLPKSLLVAATDLAATPIVFAQETQSTEPVEQVSAPAPQPDVRMPMPRVEAPRAAPRPAPRAEGPRAEAAPAPPPAAATAPAADDQRRAVPRTRDRGDNQPVGQAVPRGEVRRAPAPPPEPRSSGGRTIYAGTPRAYNNYYYYPRRSYPYGYGAFGLGYFYYDPYTWYPGYNNNYGYPVYGGYGYPGYPGYGGAYSVFDIGELRLRVSPRHAQVFVDGYYSGEVDDYDGVLQGLRLESGPYHIELVAPGYETLAFDIRINPGQKITYRGDLRPRP